MKHISKYVDEAVYELKKEAIAEWLKANGEGEGPNERQN